MDEDEDEVIAGSMREIMGMKFDDGDRSLKIDRGRYLAIDDDGFYGYNTVPEPLRGKRIRRRLPSGVRVQDLRTFLVDRGDSVDFVAIGILAIDPDIGVLVVAGDLIGDEQQRPKFDEKEALLIPMVVHNYPKRKPQNMSYKQLMAKGVKESWRKMCAELERDGEPPEFGASLFPLFCHPVLGNQSDDKQVEEEEAHNMEVEVDVQVHNVEVVLEVHNMEMEVEVHNMEVVVKKDAFTTTVACSSQNLY